MKTIKEFLYESDDKPVDEFTARREQKGLEDFHRSFMTGIQQRMEDKMAVLKDLHQQGHFKYPVGTRFISPKGNHVTITGYDSTENFSPRTGKPNHSVPLRHLMPDQFKEEMHLPAYRVDYTSKDGELTGSSRVNTWHFAEPGEGHEHSNIRLGGPLRVVK